MWPRHHLAQSMLGIIDCISAHTGPEAVRWSPRVEVLPIVVDVADGQVALVFTRVVVGVANE